MPNYRSSVWLTLISLAQTAFMLISIYTLYRINADESGLPSFGESQEALWANAALLGFVGSLLYFGRKAYVYLITNKFLRLETELTKERSVDAAGLQHQLRERVIGYYIYLCLRPIAGLVIGPAVAMLVLGGLTTLTKSGNLNAAALSSAGLFLIYLFAFIGGYTSSDMFDYLSKTGSRFLSKAKLD